MLLDPIRRALETTYANRRIVLVGRPVEQFGALGRALQAIGCPPPLVIANRKPATAPDFPIHALCIAPLAYTNSVSTFALLDDLVESAPAGVLRALDEFDPDRTAVVVSDARIHRSTFAGRTVLDAQQQSWASYERADRWWQTWRSIGARVPRLICVDTDPARMAVGYADQDLGHGVLCFGDMYSTVHEPVESVRWIRDESTLRSSQEWFKLTSGRVWMVPWLPGKACGVGGIVLSEGVVVAAPHQEFLLSEPTTGRLIQAGHRTFDGSAKNPHGAVMRELARAVGVHLARTMGFRGSFAVEGILGGSGFVPIRLVTRTARCHRHLMAGGIGGVWSLVVAAALGKLPLACDANALERQLLGMLGTQPFLTFGIPVEASPGPTARARWVTRTAPGQIALTKQRTGTRLVWSDHPSGGVLALLGGAALIRRPDEAAPTITGLLAAAREVWPLDDRHLRPTNLG